MHTHTHTQEKEFDIELPTFDFERLFNISGLRKSASSRFLSFFLNLYFENLMF